MPLGFCLLNGNSISLSFGPCDCFPHLSSIALLLFFHIDEPHGECCFSETFCSFISVFSQANACFQVGLNVIFRGIFVA